MPLFRGPILNALYYWTPRQAIGSPCGWSLSHTPRLCINLNKAIEWNRYHNRERRCCFSDCRLNDKGLQEMPTNNKQPTVRFNRFLPRLILFLSSSGVSNLNALFQFSRLSLLGNAFFGFQKFLRNIILVSLLDSWKNLFHLIN